MTNRVTRFNKLLSELDIHHAIFYHLHTFGVPIITETIDTACIEFHDHGQMFFKFNPEFYDKLTDYELKFLFCHEMLHVILNHGFLIRGRKDDINRMNVALDVVVNELLLCSFGFERDKFSDGFLDSACLLSTVFDDQQDVLEEQHAEYYYKKLIKDSKFSTLDDHSFLIGIDSKEIFNKLNELLTNEEKKDFLESIKSCGGFENQEAGDLLGNHLIIANVQNVKKKKKWETVIKKWSYQFIRDFKSYEQWARVHRRFSLLDSEFMLPSEIEDDIPENPKKIKVWFFQDTSGSCVSYADRFFKAAMTLPEWRFDVKLHCFDTRVYETDFLSKKLYGFGGTSFSCIEDYIQRKKVNGVYPDAIFVITDGMGNRVCPENAKNWYWFLTYKFFQFIPVGSNLYELKDFE